MSEAGGLKDVSVGLHDGDPICDICGNDLRARDSESREYLCQHAPGTHRGMKQSEIASQKKRDPKNKRGAATFTLHNAGLGEVSGVYDGAVPGAGIKKVMSFAAGADMSQEAVRNFLEEAMETYGPLLPFDLNEVVELKPAASENNPGGTFMEDENGEETEELNQQPAPANTELEEKLAAATAQLVVAQNELSAARIRESAQARTAFEASLSKKIPPAARPTLLAVYDVLAEGGQAAKLTAYIEASPMLQIFDSQQVDLTEVQAPPQTEEKLRDARRRELLSATDLGREVLANEEKTGK